MPPKRALSKRPTPKKRSTPAKAKTSSSLEIEKETYSTVGGGLASLRSRSRDMKSELGLSSQRRESLGDFKSPDLPEDKPQVGMEEKVLASQAIEDLGAPQGLQGAQSRARGHGLRNHQTSLQRLVGSLVKEKTSLKRQASQAGGSGILDNLEEVFI